MVQGKWREFSMVIGYPGTQLELRASEWANSEMEAFQKIIEPSKVPGLFLKRID